MEFETFELSNGIRVVHRQNDRPVAHCGLLIQAGSRDETPEEEGLAHFIEHVLFKGTHKRKAFHILSRMEDAGGELNAFTDKENTVIYTSFLTPDYGRAIELICDISFRSIFPEKELEKEKEVIIDEINSYRDSPAELIFDEFDELLFPGHGLGMNILGQPQRIRQFTRQHVLDFIQRHYGTNRMVISSVGQITTKRLRQKLEKALREIDLAERPLQRHTPKKHRPQRLEKPKALFQTHVILGTHAYPARADKARVLHLLNNILGGPGMNSRLNLNIRERYGFTYNIESFYSPYSDTGVFGIYAGTDPHNIDKTLKLIYRELKNLREKPLGTLQLSRAKKQFLGQLALAQENNVSLMIGLGKSLLNYGYIEGFEELRQKIESITARDLQEVAGELLQPDQMSSLVYAPPPEA